MVDDGALKLRIFYMSTRELVDLPAYGGKTSSAVGLRSGGGSGSHGVGFISGLCHSLGDQ